MSSAQLDRAERGFSFQKPGPLDMRMDQSASVSAADLVNGASQQELARIFFEYGEESAGAGWRRRSCRRGPLISPIMDTMAWRVSSRG